MAETFKNKSAIFRSGDQRRFIESAEERFSVEKIAKICSCSTRTIRDWRKEKFPMQLTSVHALAKQAGIQLPANLKTRDRYAHTARAGLKGAHVVLAKYGRVPIDENRRKAQWEAWWNAIGKYKPRHKNFVSKSVYKPGRSVKLAEFMGTMMGDGGMSTYQACITLHHIDDREYVDFVAGRMRSLFHVEPSLYHLPRNSVFNIVISRVEIVAYLHSLGLPIGNKVKQEFDIPDWIKNNTQFAIACVRGLVDTDGSVYTHSYKVKGKRYHYKKLSFCSRSRPLQYSVAKILTDLGICARISGSDVRVDSIPDVKKYFKLVGSSNPKHLKRYAD